MGQIIISICREYASAGHIIGQKLAERMGISFYDSNLLDEMAAADADNKLNIDRMQKFDEQPKPFFARTVRGMKGSPEENVAQIQFDFLRYKAESGESFVIVGRCAEEALSGFPCLIKIFVLADEEGYEDDGDYEDTAYATKRALARTRRDLLCSKTTAPAERITIHSARLSGASLTAMTCASIRQSSA